MRKLLIFALAGFVAQLIDGSLGMGFGASSSSILLTFGITPAVVSATVHFSEIATTAASGTSHLKFKNVHKPTMFKLAIPGAVTAFVGAALLTHIKGDNIKPFIALFLLSMGLYILYQFLFKRNHPTEQRKTGNIKSYVAVSQGAIAGFLDSIGGGGWGPVNTPLLLSSKKLEPRFAIGTVSASEFFVTLSASVSFVIFLGVSQINWGLVIALSIGGMIAAPISALLVRILPVNILAICVSGLIIFTNSNALLQYLVPSASIANIIKIGIVLAFIILMLFVINRNRSFKQAKNKKKVEV
ncbi:sulfite exporter TauE/SafE family protein [Staphylococcus sp. SQ8-PEA]|uniref:Probable membrane transporter protein n=1 Tax=Staphylococcus marylandisciuri TaxID=2981529 RepID=A0ABT2QQR3_9STAP|nr:sulfite exporter TauE/SafE family protein [Staphylococcus marylandisciuri]MCU5746288.1 sulfite exporter TauE/SafE family protein [Staphylococcus marylandisciuri]